MSEQMAAALERETRHFLELLDSLDMSGLAAIFTDDAQGVDEISRGWMRGRAALEAYLAQLEGQLRTSDRSSATFMRPRGLTLVW